jgi:hypothetical protein
MTWRRKIARLAGRLLGRHTGLWCGCPVCAPQEREMRDMLGMPGKHPESLTRELPAKQEAKLAALAAELWPADEWADIIIEVRRAEGQP